MIDKYKPLFDAPGLVDSAPGSNPSDFLLFSLQLFLYIFSCFFNIPLYLYYLNSFLFFFLLRGWLCPAIYVLVGLYME